MLHALLRRGEARLEQSSLSKNIETFLFVLFFFQSSVVPLRNPEESRINGRLTVVQTI